MNTKAKSQKKTGKKSNTKRKNKGGRPIEFNDTVVRKLEELFMEFANDTEACLVAGITRETYYKRIREDQKFSDRMAVAKNYPILKAKINVSKGVEQLKNPEFALKVLQSKRNDEFPNRHNVEVTGDLNTKHEVVHFYLPDNGRSGERPSRKESSAKPLEAKKPIKTIKLKKKKR